MVNDEGIIIIFINFIISKDCNTLFIYRIKTIQNFWLSLSLKNTLILISH